MTCLRAPRIGSEPHKARRARPIARTHANLRLRIVPLTFLFPQPKTTLTCMSRPGVTCIAEPRYNQQEDKSSAQICNPCNIWGVLLAPGVPPPFDSPRCPPWCLSALQACLRLESTDRLQCRAKLRILAFASSRQLTEPWEPTRATGRLTDRPPDST